MAGKPTKRRRDDDNKGKPKYRVKKQKRYHSSSEDESEEETVFKARDAPKPILKKAPVANGRTSASGSENDSDEDTQLAINTALNAGTALEDEDEELEDEELEDAEEQDNDDALQDELEEEEDDDAASESDTSMTSSQAARSKKKRNDPTAFATSISKILDTKLSTSKRSDPVLSRSKSAAEANKTLANDRLEAKARAQIRSERKAAQEKGRVKDVLGVEDDMVDSGAIMEGEKRLKKTAQRGVVKLFNAVRAAQVKAEEAVKQARTEGVVGMRQREEKVNEMSKQGFLDLISSGGK